MEYVIDHSNRPCIHLIKIPVKGREHMIECGDLPAPDVMNWLTALGRDWEWGVYGTEIWAQFESQEDAMYFRLTWC